MKTKNKTFTFRELRDFVNSQKDDRQINMAQGADNLGCVLTQFLRKRFKKKISLCGFSMASYWNSPKTTGFMMAVPEDKEITEKYMTEMIGERLTDYATAKKLLNTKTYA